MANAISTIRDGRAVVTVAGTRSRLSSSPLLVTSVIITAETSNAGVIVVGGPTVIATPVTRRGTPLTAGESMSIAPDAYRNAGIDLYAVWLDATSSGDGVTFSYQS